MNKEADENNKEDAKEEPKPLLKEVTEPEVKRKEKKKKSVGWDWKSLEEQEKDRLLHPVLMKIDEPKTPYIPYEEGDDEYLKKLNEVNQIQPTEEVLNNVISQLEIKGNRKDSSDQEEYVELEVIQPDGSVKKELKKRDKKEKEEFLKKRHKAYENEFTNAKNFFNENKDDELMDTTLSNTLINKFSGKITAEQIKKDRQQEKEKMTEIEKELPKHKTHEKKNPEDKKGE